MPGFSNLKAYIESVECGKSKYSTWRKTPSQATVSGIWFDLSMMPGNPLPNYYANVPLTAAVLNGGEGIFHGAAVSPAKKYLKSLTAIPGGATGLPLSLLLCDYLLYYPTLDQGTNDDQTLINNVALPRYTDGMGVKAVAVMTNPQQGSAPTFNFTYTNQDGVEGRTSQTVTCAPTATVFGSVINAASATAGASQVFIGLQGNDTGIRKIDAFRMVAGTDVGLICLVLVKPLAKLVLRGVDAPVEVDYLRDSAQLPEIKDGAYLNFLVCPTGSLAAIPIHGDATFVWN